MLIVLKYLSDTNSKERTVMGYIGPFADKAEASAFLERDGYRQMLSGLAWYQPNKTAARAQVHELTPAA